jgi:tetratricopeptide (TPR) repeat protein
VTRRGKASKKGDDPVRNPYSKGPTDATTGGVRAVGDRSVAVGGSLLGVASSGDNALNMVIHGGHVEVRPAPTVASPALVAPPGRLRNVPAPPLQFVGRAEALVQLDDFADPSATAGVQVVCGLGGVGKSSLVTHWARANAGGLNPIWWVAADDWESIESGLASLAVAIHPSAMSLALPAAAEWATQWLSTHSDWLLILDNVNDRRDISDLVARATRGRIVVTTRRAVTAWYSLGAAMRLDVLHRDEATSLLTRILAHTGERRDQCLDGAEELCTELGYLPLAVEQAGAYIAETGITPRAYLDTLNRYPAVMFRHAATDSDVERTIGRIWRITLDRLATDVLPVELLRAVAFYAPEPIPRAIFHVLLDPLHVDWAIGRLAAYSMVTVKPDDGTFTVHRLVQSVTRTPDPEDPHRQPAAIEQARIRATQALDLALLDDYDDPGTWDTWRLLERHADVLIKNSPPENDIDHTGRLLNQIALFRSEQGDRQGAAEYFERAYSSVCRLEGESSEHAMVIRHNLASLYTDLGRLDEALPYAEQVVADRQATFGAEHPDTLVSCMILANVYRASGKLTRAVRLLERTLAVSRRVLGDGHLDTVQVRNRLAGALRETGALARAVSLHEQNLAILTNLPDAPRSLGITLRGNLAVGYNDMGRTDEAIQLLGECLADAHDLFGDRHPETLALRNNLARAYQKAGDTGRAIEELELLLEDYVHVLGDQDPETIGVRENLADAYASAGRLDGGPGAD